MPRTKGSKNKPKTVTADFATQIAEKQSAKEAFTAEITSITANIDTLKADLKEKKKMCIRDRSYVGSIFYENRNDIFYGSAICWTKQLVYINSSSFKFGRVRCRKCYGL